jgi:hypothetical protein
MIIFVPVYAQHPALQLRSLVEEKRGFLAQKT